MKQKVVTLLIITTLLATPLTVSAAGRNRLTVDEVKARAAEAQAKGKKSSSNCEPEQKFSLARKRSHLNLYAARA